MMQNSQKSQMTLVELCNCDDLEPDTAAVKLNLDKVHGIPGSSKHAEPESPREMLRKHQWMDG